MAKRKLSKNGSKFPESSAIFQLIAFKSLKIMLLMKNIILEIFELLNNTFLAIASYAYIDYNWNTQDIIVLLDSHQLNSSHQRDNKNISIGFIKVTILAKFANLQRILLRKAQSNYTTEYLCINALKSRYK